VGGNPEELVITMRTWTGTKRKTGSGIFLIRIKEKDRGNIRGPACPKGLFRKALWRKNRGKGNGGD